MPVTVRLATDDDVDAVGRVHYSGVMSCESYYGEHAVTTWALGRRAKGYETILNQPSTVALVASLNVGGPVVGFAVGNLTTGEVCGLYVDPSLHRKGVGAALMSELEGRLGEAGWGEYFLTATVPAVLFYEGRGYVKEKDGSHDAEHDGVKVTMDCVHMRKVVGKKEE